MFRVPLKLYQWAKQDHAHKTNFKVVRKTQTPNFSFGFKTHQVSH